MNKGSFILSIYFFNLYLLNTLLSTENPAFPYLIDESLYFQEDPPIFPDIWEMIFRTVLVPLIHLFNK